MDREYFQAREDKKAINSATGKCGEIWKRQQGTCFYCRRPILPDQERTVVALDMDKPPHISNLAYVHSLCKTNELTVFEVLGDISVYSSRELLETTQEIMSLSAAGKKIKGPITEKWPHIELKRWFAEQSAASITLSFRQLEKIDRRPLPEIS